MSPLTLLPIPREAGPGVGDLYKYANPIVESWTGVSGKGIALRQTQVSDASNYAGDFANAGTGNLALRAVAGSNSVIVNASGTIVTGLATLSVGNLTVTGTLGVSGASTLSSASFSGAVTMATTLGVTGAVTLQSTLGVAGASTISSLNASGAVVLQSTLNVTGATTLAGGATVSAGNLAVSSGTSSLGGATTVTTGDLTVTSGRLLIGASAAKIVGGATSLSIRNSIDTVDNLVVTDAGVATIRGGLTVSSGTTTLGTLNAGAISGSTGTFSGAISGTTITGSSTVQGTRFVSTVTTGTSPLSVSSTTQVTNLNANFLQGQGASAFAVAGHTTSGDHDSRYLQLTGGTVSGTLTVTSTATIQGNLVHTASGGAVGFYGVSPVSRATITGSRGGNAALLDLITKLENLGLIINNTS